ncbi:HNH endonuclease [Bosea vaviloviae]|uniref:HNH endonuclease n=1 Tax=Bosea vaviloviae TaxID=1526658 RepID=UPI0009EBE9DF|nr:HNH endonuclease [Bosea vaviloviae]
MAEWPYNTSTWQKLRKAKLSQSPICYACELRGHVETAVAVDHVISMKAGGDPFPTLEGLMSLCERCHNEKTSAVDQPGRASTGRRFKGFDVNGNPIDPGDEWHGVGVPQITATVSG